MKKILVVILALVAVFCAFVGCGDAPKGNNADNNTNVIDDNTGNENNAGDTDNENNTDDTGNGENDGEDNGNGNGQSGKVVSPITDGGSFDDGGNYS